MEQRQSELTVITKAKDLCAYVITVTQKSPKQFRFTFVSRMQNLCLDVIECLYRANDTFVAVEFTLNAYAPPVSAGSCTVPPHPADEVMNEQIRKNMELPESLPRPSGGMTENLGLISGDPQLNYIQLPMESTQFSSSFTISDYAAMVSALYEGKYRVSNDYTVDVSSLAGTVTVKDLGNLK